MNRDRSLTRRAEAIRIGNMAVHNQLGAGWFYHTCDDPAEAQYRYEEHVAETTR